MIEFKIENKDNRDVLSYTDYKTDGSKVEGQVKNPNNGDVLDPELFLNLFKDKKPAESYERASSYNDSYCRLYAFNPNVSSSTNAVKVSIKKNSNKYQNYCNELEDMSYSVNLENSKVAKDNRLKNFASFVAVTTTAGLVAASIALAVLVADHGYDINSTISDLKNHKVASEINTMQTTSDAFNQMIDDGAYHASRK